MDEKKLRIYIDGASRGNPGEGALAVLVQDGEGREIERVGRRIGSVTNNVAEYRALIAALEYVDSRVKAGRSTREVTIYSDSELLVKQLEGSYSVKSASLLPLFEEAERYLEAFGFVRVKHVNRDLNRTADWIANRVLDGKPFTSDSKPPS